MRGFSLLEILVTLAIMSILALFSISIFSSHFQQADRLEAAQALLKVAVLMEEHYLKHHGYQGASLQDFGLSEKIGRGNYELKISDAKQHHYRLLAIPKTGQHEACGTLILNEKGEKSITGSAELADCW